MRRAVQSNSLAPTPWITEIWLPRQNIDRIVNIVNTPASKRIPLSEERGKELHDLKEAGQTYDELLEELVREHRREKLAEKARKARAGEDEWKDLEELG